MKNISKLILASLALLMFLAGCSKTDKYDTLPLYEAGVSPVISSSATSVTLVLADSLKTVLSFSWTNPKYANDSATTKYILEIDSTGKNFANANTRTIAGALTTSFTGRELNAILLNMGLKLGSAHSIDARVVSSYKNNNERYMSNVVKISVTPFADPSVLKTANTSVIVTLANGSLPSNTFSWTPSFSGYTGVVTYTIQYDSAGKNFVAPTEIEVGPSLFTKQLTQAEMNATALTSGIPGGNSGKVEYRIKAVTALGAIAYSNLVTVTIQSYVPILRLYLAGSFQAATGYGSDWTPATGPELIRDLRTQVFNDLYYTYIYMPAGAEFKVTVGRSWDVNYGGAGGSLSSGGANLSVAAAGYYRISVNRKTLKYDIRAGRMGFVGGATGAGWTPPNVFPTYAMGAAATNLFVGLTTFTANDAWKLIDNNSWNDGTFDVGETRSYGSAGGDGSTVEINGSNNFPSITDALSRKRVIWDGRDVNNVKYFISPATEMRIVGDGINKAGVNDWDPPTSPQMTYSGNGIWTLSLTLKAGKEIKFLAGNAWGAFDYEDKSGGIQTLGTPRSIAWDGGGNFKTPAAAGTYTIILNENLQTVTIN